MGDRHFKYMPLPTYLIYLSPKELHVFDHLSVTFFIRLATELYDQWQINELVFHGAAYRLSSYRNSYIKSAP